ncbi:MAG: SpoIIIAH-like family protein, partial [Eubacteriales bacterium]|nr:SpoIIIAH-like family protein [Eubacteriales bacterium]
MKHFKNLRRNLVLVAVLFFVGAAAYLNWSYNERWDGTDNAEMVAAEDAAMAEADAEYEEAMAEGESGTASQETVISDYFADARLTRQQSRDEALGLLEIAASADAASQETIDSAMNAIAAMANWSLMESQIENELLAKGFEDCVVY